MEKVNWFCGANCRRCDGVIFLAKFNFFVELLSGTIGHSMWASTTMQEAIWGGPRHSANKASFDSLVHGCQSWVGHQGIKSTRYGEDNFGKKML